MSDSLKPEPSIGDIIGEVAATERAAASLAPDDLKSLADRVDLLTADFGRWESYKAASAEYITAFRDEVDWHRRIRLAVSVACAIIVLFFAILLVVVLRHANTIFDRNSGHALTALIVATVTGSVIITIAVTKGAFQTMADRNAGLPMPDHMKEIVEAGKNLIGGGKL
ncbi:hypothetical protein ACFOKI_10575 [Sphingomonas qilianensis]|uniref:Phage holin family protein n=1 Tax=Sphingomonas qilianensis TaxID=1736690 RepID=A0ABU9XPR5_9SPHN